MSDTTIGPQGGATAAPLVLQTGVAAWWQQRRARRARLDFTVWDLHERYGAAAYPIALSSARQAGARQTRRFWMQVATRLRRRSASADD